MKNQILLLLIIIISVSCRKDTTNNYQQLSSVQGGESIIPKWNKANTGVVYFISNLQDIPFANTEDEYKKVGLFLKDKKYAIAIIDRSDIFENTHFNGGVTATYYACKKNAFAFNQYKSNILEGSTLIVDNVEKQQLIKIGERFYLTYFPTYLIPEIVFPFTTFRVENEAQVASISNQLNYWREQKFVCIGTINNEVLKLLKQQVESKSSLKFTLIESSEKKPYSIFMIAPKSWVLRQKEVIKQDQKSIYELNIEANVFY